MLRTFTVQGLILAGVIAAAKRTLIFGSTKNNDKVTGARNEGGGHRITLQGYAKNCDSLCTIWHSQVS